MFDIEVVSLIVAFLLLLSGIHFLALAISCCIRCAYSPEAVLSVDLSPGCVTRESKRFCHDE